jgi:hypothetical protein
MKDEPMPLPDDEPATIRALLETLHRQQVGGIALTEDDLIRWLEGTLSAERMAAVEATLVHQPELRRALAAARLRHEDALPAAELAALEALVASPAALFPAADVRAPRRALLWAAAAAVALLVPAWRIGSGIAEQQRQVEDRELREFLNPGLTKGGL